MNRTLEDEEDFESELVFQLSEEFLAAQRRGEKPEIESYCQRYPQVATELKDLLQTIQMMESLPDNQQAQKTDLNLDVGRELGDYRLVRLIGEGGMGVVYEAQQVSLHRRVAVKILRKPVGIEQQARERFLREAKAVAQLHHTNIVPIFEVGEQGETNFFAMQLIEGMSLDRLIAHWNGNQKLNSLDDRSTAKSLVDTTQPIDQESREPQVKSLYEHEVPKRLGSREIVRLVIQAARALEYSHERGIIHRDVKPSNLILDAQGAVWLTDFGLAKFEQGDLTTTGDFLGTLRYMSPERFSGECDEQADVYALGLTLYELIALKPAFPDNNHLELIEAIRNSKPVPLRSLVPGISKDLETLVLTACAPLREQRYPSAKQFADDLECFLNDEPISARPPSAAEKLYRWSKKNKLVASLCFLLFLVLSLTTIIMSQAYWSQKKLTQQKKDESKRANIATDQASQALKLAEQRGQELRQRLYLSEMQQTSRLLLDPLGADKVRKRLIRWNPDRDSDEPDLRGWEWYWLHAKVNQVVAQVTLGKQQIIGADWLDADRVIAGGANVKLHIVDFSTHPPTQNGIDINTYVASLALHPDKKRVAISVRQPKVLVFLDLQLRKFLWRNDLPNHLVYGLTWNSSGELLAGYFDNHWMVWNASNGQIVHKGRLTTPVVSLVWYPGNNDDQTLVISSDVTSETWNLKSGKRLKIGNDSRRWIAFDPSYRCRVSRSINSSLVERKLDTGNWNASNPPGFLRVSSLSPDANWLAYKHESGALEIWDTRTGEIVRKWIGHSDEIRSIAWDKNSRRIVTGANDGTIRLWSMERRPAMRPFSGTFAQARFSPDGTRFAISNGREVTVRNLDGTIAQTLGPIGHRVKSITWSGTGNELVFGTDQGTVELWELDHEKPIRKWQMGFKHGLPLNRLVYLHKGNKLAACSGAHGVQVLNAGTGDILEEFQLHRSSVLDIAYHANKKLVATAGANGEALVWNPEDGSIKLRLKGHRGFVTAVCWAPKGDRLVTGGNSGEVLIWDTETGQELQRLDGQTRRVTSLDWSPDGKRIVGGGLDLQIHLWNPDFEDELMQLDFKGVEPERVYWSASGDQLLASGELGTVLLDAREHKDEEQNR